MKRKVDPNFDIKPSIVHRLNARLVELYLGNGARILDVGCWTGQLIRAFKTQKKFCYFGIDTSQEAIKHTAKIKTGGKFKLASALNIPYKDEYFDIVCLFDVLEHISERTETVCLKGIRRVLKKEGVLIISTPADNILSKIFDPAYFFSNHRHYSKDKVVNFLKSCGFRIISFETRGSFFYGVYILLQLTLKHVFNSPYPHWRIFERLKKRASNEIKQRGFMSHYIVAAAR